MRIQKRATLLNALSQALMVGVMIAASNSGREGPTVYDPYGQGSNRGDMIVGSQAAGILVTELLLRSYSREFEDEADEEGQRWAALAGYDPDGTGQLMRLMQSRIPQSKAYGYWRTHPYYEERVLASDARKAHLPKGESKSPDRFRVRTQERLLAFLEEASELPPPGVLLVKREALHAWPAGPSAEFLRIEALNKLKTDLATLPELKQDYGRLVKRYEEQIREIDELTPESLAVRALELEVEQLNERRAEIYPRALEVLEGGIYETDFLEVFASNYPDSERIQEVTLALGDAYSRLGRQGDAVRQYLRAKDVAPDTPEGQRAQRGLRTLAAYLDRLDALQELVDQEEDPELAAVARTRLVQLASRYEDLPNGAEFLKRWPDAELVDVVGRRLDNLADELLGEIILYQTVGDSVKALERITLILTYAPLSPAANRLRENAVLAG